MIKTLKKAEILMVKRQRAPSGFYTAMEAIELLGMSRSTFFSHVKAKKIKKTLPPSGGKEGYYEKKVVDAMVQAKALFALNGSIEPIIFSRAQSEEDLRGIVELCVAIYGQGGTPSYEARLEIWKKNPDVYYIIRQESIVVGYISLIWFDDEALKTLMGPTPKYSRITPAGTGVYSVTGPEHVKPFIDGQPIDSLFVSLGIRPGAEEVRNPGGKNGKFQRGYAMRLLRGTQEVLADFARRGMPIRMIYATSEHDDGKKLAKTLKMKETRYPGDPLIRYELAVDESNSKLFKSYKKVIATRNV